jgi:S1-C subfamily serine protease
MMSFFRSGPRLVLVSLLLAWGVFAQVSSAQEKKADKVEPALTIKPVPESIEDLRAIEKQVQAVLEKVTPATVGVQVGPGQGSGVIVSADGLVLTAGHVSVKPGENATIILPTGKRLRAKTLGRNGGIDSGMIKIIDEGPFPFADLGKSADLKAGQWCIAVGHPGGFRPNRAPVVRVGRILFASNSFLRTDATLVGGDSGGPLFDMQGKVIGIHSRISKSITENVHVPIDTYHQTWDRLVKGDSWGGNIGIPSLVQSAGGKIILEEKGQINATDPRDAKFTDSYHKVFTIKMVPGFAYTIDLVSKNFDAYLRLEDSTGKQLTDNDDGGGKQNSRIVYRPSRADTYRIIATTFEPGQTGAYTLTVYQAEIQAKDLAEGKVDILQAMKVPRPLAPQLLGQLARAGIDLYANAHLFDETGKPLAEKELTFRWKTGKASQKTDDQGQARLQLSREKLDELVLDLPKGIKALVQLTDEEGNPPPLKLNLQKEKVPSAGGTVVMKKEGRIKADDPRDKFLVNSNHHALTFKMSPGFAYTLDLESKDFDAYLRLEDATGKTLAFDDDSLGNLNARIVFRPTQEEEYRIVIAAFQGGQTGNYALTIRQAESKK